MKYYHFKKKGKQYVCPRTEDDYVISDYETKDVYDLTEDNYNWQSHKNHSKTIGKTIYFG